MERKRSGERQRRRGGGRGERKIVRERIKAERARALRENTWDFLRRVGGESSKFPRVGLPDRRAASAAERWLLTVTPRKVGGISRVLPPSLFLSLFFPDYAQRYVKSMRFTGVSRTYSRDILPLNIPLKARARATPN